jgi:hypothetical protein
MAGPAVVLVPFIIHGVRRLATKPVAEILKKAGYEVVKGSTKKGTKISKKEAQRITPSAWGGRAAEGRTQRATRTPKQRTPKQTQSTTTPKKPKGWEKIKNKWKNMSKGSKVAFAISALWTTEEIIDLIYDGDESKKPEVKEKKKTFKYTEDLQKADKKTADVESVRVSKAAKKYKPKPKPEKVKAKKAKISKVEPSVLGSEEAGKEWFKKYFPEMDRKELYTYPTDPEDNGGDKTIKQEFGKHGGKVVKRRGGGKALRGFGRATYSDKLY